MIEILVAILVGALIAYALCQSTAQALRMSSASQNEAYANSVVENLLECCRAIDYSSLSALKGQTVDISDCNENQPSLNFHQYPILINLSNTWDKVNKSKFSGDAKLQIDEGPDAGNSLAVSITVKWSDSVNFQSPRTLERSIVRFVGVK